MLAALRCPTGAGGEADDERQALAAARAKLFVLGAARGAGAVRSPASVPVPMSARSEAALRGQAERLREHLAARPELALVDVAYSLATTRSHLEHRAAMVAHDRVRAA